MRTIALVFTVLTLCGCECAGSAVYVQGFTDGGGSRDAGGTGGSGAGGAGGSSAGGGSGAGGSSGSGGGGACGVILATVRDFSDTHPDFETFAGSQVALGLVENTLDSEHKPVHAAAGPTSQTSGPANFRQWYRDDAGVTRAFTVPLPLTLAPNGGYTYENGAFFPIDDAGFGNQGRDHNFHFTTEIHTSFVYVGGERFTFRGDDDVWVFINRKLALDLGGTHPQVEGTIDFDAKASGLGLVKGQTYPFDVFHAERHTTESNFRVQTSIDCFLGEIN